MMRGQSGASINGDTPGQAPWCFPLPTVGAFVKRLRAFELPTGSSFINCNHPYGDLHRYGDRGENSMPASFKIGIECPHCKARKEAEPKSSTTVPSIPAVPVITRHLESSIQQVLPATALKLNGKLICATCGWDLGMESSEQDIPEEVGNTLRPLLQECMFYTSDFSVAEQPAPNMEGSVTIKSRTRSDVSCTVSWCFMEQAQLRPDSRNFYDAKQGGGKIDAIVDNTIRILTQMRFRLTELHLPHGRTTNWDHNHARFERINGRDDAVPTIVMGSARDIPPSLRIRVEVRWVSRATT